MGPGPGKKVDPAGEAHQLGHPVSRGHERIDPLDAGHSRRRIGTGGTLSNIGDTLTDRSHKVLAAFPLAEDFGHASDGGPDRLQCVGFQGDDLGAGPRPIGHGACNVRFAHGAHFALGLSEDHIGP